MRAAQAITTVTEHVRDVFDDDVADVIIGDRETFEAAASFLGARATSEEIADVIRRIADDTDDGTLDWLVAVASSPGAWLYRQIKEQLG